MIGDDSLVCHKEVGNVHDAHAVAIFWENSVVGHVPQNLVWLLLEIFDAARDVNSCRSIR